MVRPTGSVLGSDEFSVNTGGDGTSSSGGNTDFVGGFVEAASFSDRLDGLTRCSTSQGKVSVGEGSLVDGFRELDGEDGSVGRIRVSGTSLLVDGDGEGAGGSTDEVDQTSDEGSQDDGTAGSDAGEGNGSLFPGVLGSRKQHHPNVVSRSVDDGGHLLTERTEVLTVVYEGVEEEGEEGGEDESEVEKPGSKDGRCMEVVEDSYVGLSKLNKEESKSNEDQGNSQRTSYLVADRSMAKEF